MLMDELLKYLVSFWVSAFGIGIVIDLFLYGVNKAFRLIFIH